MVVYRRRYFPVLTVPTQDLQEGAVTQDKLANNAVGSDNLIDGTVQNIDLAPGAVTNTKLADGSVSNSKIVDGAVTDSKLSTTFATRPLSPGVATAEIQNGAVTEEKIAAGAFGTAAIADGAVTTPKLAGSSVTKEKIGAGQVGGTEIEDGAVSEDKLSDNSVSLDKMKDNSVGEDEILVDTINTDHIQDGVVTGPKLSNGAVYDEKTADNLLRVKHLFELYSKAMVFYDDFVGSTLRDDWTASGDAGGNAAVQGHMVEIESSAVANEKYRINFGGKNILDVDDYPAQLFIRAAYAGSSSKTVIGWYKDASNYLAFVHDSSVDGNWHSVTMEAGTPTNTDTGVAATSALQDFFIDVRSDVLVYFWIDGDIKTTHITNIHTGGNEPWCEVETLTTSQKTLSVDKVVITGGNYEIAAP